VINTNAHSDLGSFFRPLEPDETAIIQKEVLNTYKNFMGRVAEGRNLTIEQVDKIGRGHVYTAIDAKEIGLVDELGGLNKAIEIAATEAKLTDYRTVEYPKLEAPFDAFIKQLTEDVKIKMIQEDLGIEYKYYKQLQAVKSMRGIQAIMPFEVDLF
jgi:protease-4